MNKLQHTSAESSWKTYATFLQLSQSWFTFPTPSKKRV